MQQSDFWLNKIKKEIPKNYTPEKPWFYHSFLPWVLLCFLSCSARFQNSYLFHGNTLTLDSCPPAWRVFCFAEPAWASGGRRFLWQSRGQCIFLSDSVQSRPHQVGLAAAAFILTALYSHTDFELSSPEWMTCTAEKWGIASPNFYCFSFNIFNFWGPFPCSSRFKPKILCSLHRKTNNCFLLLNSLQEHEHCFSNTDESIFPQGRKIMVWSV